MTDPIRRRDFLKASAALAGAAATSGLSGVDIASAQRIEAAIENKPPPIRPLRRRDPTINFTEGVPSRVSVTSLLPVGADRYHGGFFPQNFGTGAQIEGIGFDPVTKEITYDGSPLSKNPSAINPSSNTAAGGYYVGGETAPYNAHWQFPPTTHTIPYPTYIAGALTHVAIDGGCKHTRPRYCPRDRLIHIFGGDYSSYNLVGAGSNGRMLMWHLDPTLADHASGWGLDYPAHGRVGEDEPLSPDIMGYSWDPTRQIWWVSYGDIRAGYWGNAAPDGDPNPQNYFQNSGGLATAWPAIYTDGTHAPLFVFDPKLTQPKYIKLANLPWDTNNVKFHESAYDDGSKRLYKMGQSPSASVRVWYLDTTLYETTPLSMPWISVDIDLSAGSAANLTGGDYSTIVGMWDSPMHVDDTGRRLFFIDSHNRAILALTLPGNPAGVHKVQLIAHLPGMRDFNALAQGLLACASMPFMWIPEHRSLVIMAEPLQAMGGPQSYSATINVDTGVVTDGPRFPTNPKDGLPWFPGAGVWYPPTQELVLYACYADIYDTSRSWKNTSPSGGGDWPWTLHRYAWVP